MLKVFDFIGNAWDLIGIVLAFLVLFAIAFIVAIVIIGVIQALFIKIGDCFMPSKEETLKRICILDSKNPDMDSLKELAKIINRKSYFTIGGKICPSEYSQEPCGITCDECDLMHITSHFQKFILKWRVNPTEYNLEKVKESIEGIKKISSRLGAA